MSDDNASHLSPPEGERAYWLDQPENGNLLIKILIVVGVTSTHLSPWSRRGEPWQTGTTAMWAAALLLAYLFLSY